MTPAHALAKLERQLSRHGQNADLRKMAGGAIVSEVKGVRAFVRGFKPDELVGPILQGDRNIVLLPEAPALDLKKGDKIVIAGTVTNIESAEIVRMADMPVRVNVRVRG